MSELKPCPFCGGKAKFDYGDKFRVWVYCTSCGISSDFDRFDVEGYRIRLATHWNRRAELEQEPEQKAEEIRPFGGIRPTEGEQYFVINPYTENGITRGYYTGQSDRRAINRGLAFCSPDYAALVADAIFVMTELRNQPGAGEQKEGGAWIAFLSNFMRRGTLMRVLAIGNWANGQRANEIVNSICPPFPSQELLVAALNAVGRDRVERALRVWAMLPVAREGGVSDAHTG